MQYAKNTTTIALLSTLLLAGCDGLQNGTIERKKTSEQDVQVDAPPATLPDPSLPPDLMPGPVPTLQPSPSPTVVPPSPSPSASPSPKPSPVPSPVVSGLSFSAQSGVLSGPMVKASDYIWVPEGTGGNDSANGPRAGTARYSFKVDQAGTYKLFATVHVPDGESDSIYVGVNGQSPFKWYPQTNSAFQAAEVLNLGNAQVFTLSAGTHSLLLSHREDGLKIKHLEFKRVTAPTPTPIPTPSPKVSPTPLPTPVPSPAPSLPVAGRKFYIAPNGNDSAAGSISAPWKSFAKANSTLQPGDAVYIRGGTYKESIQPVRSGVAGKPISYIRYGNEEVIITDVTWPISISLKNYIFVDGIKTTNTRRWISLEQVGNYNVIQNSQFIATPNTNEWCGVCMAGNASYNKFIGNSFIGGAAGPHDLFYLRPAAYNLIMNNTLVGGTHNAIAILGTNGNSYYNIIKGNKITNRWHTGLAVFKNSNFSVVEGNTIVDSGEDHAINFGGSERDRSLERSRHNGIQMGSVQCIIRNNTMINNGDAISLNSYEGYDGLNNRIYHNSLSKNYTGFSVNSVGELDGNRVKNNIFKSHIKHNIHIQTLKNFRDIRVIANNLFDGKLYNSLVGEYPLSTMESKLPDLWQDNISIDPQFENEGARDLRLKSNSPMINQGQFLTEATRSGSGTSLEVDDAKYFIDGYGLIPGDEIQLEGQTVRARILDITGNTLKLDRSLTWTKGQGVSLPYNGSAPDLGAHER